MPTTMRKGRSQSKVVVFDLLTRRLGLPLQSNNGRAGAAFIGRRSIETLDVSVAGQELRDRFAQRAFTVAVNDAHAFSPGHKRLVKKLVDAIGCLVDVRAYDVDLGCEMRIDTDIRTNPAR